MAFGYTDLDGNKTTRAVLPLALVHPPQGVKLLAWCAERQDFRQFFVRSMQGPTPQPGDFSGDRTALLEGLLDKYTGRALASRCKRRAQLGPAHSRQGLARCKGGFRFGWLPPSGFRKLAKVASEKESSTLRS